MKQKIYCTTCRQELEYDILPHECKVPDKDYDSQRLHWFDKHGTDFSMTRHPSGSWSWSDTVIEHSHSSLRYAIDAAMLEYPGGMPSDRRKHLK